MNKIVVKEMVKTTQEGDVPVVKVLITDDSDAVISTGYLSPFRGYCFQVSGTAEGEWDMGASTVIGLGHIFDIRNHSGRTMSSIYSSNVDMNGIIRELLLGQAVIALTKWGNREDAILPSNTLTLDSMGKMTPMGKFIRDCFIFIENCFERVRALQ